MTRTFDSRADAVVVATVIFEAAVATMLITRWHERLALALATLWVLGLIPALAWPYWLVNVPLAMLFGTFWWRSGRTNDRRPPMRSRPQWTSCNFSQPI